jgi:hypothetical protein
MPAAIWGLHLDAREFRMPSKTHQMNGVPQDHDICGLDRVSVSAGSNNLDGATEPSKLCKRSLQLARGLLLPHTCDETSWDGGVV